MANYIKRDELLRHYDEYYCKPCREKKDDYYGVRCRACGTGDAIETAEDIPAADVRENVHGEWIFEKGDGKTCVDGWCCSNCKQGFHANVPYFSDYNFCPNCGVSMQTEKKGSDYNRTDT